jgi:hypothetical protein
VAVTTASRTDSGARVDRLLLAAATLFTVAVVVHNGDHLRRGFDALDGDVFAAGTASIVLEVGVVALVVARHRLAPLAALAVGASLAPGYVLVHFLPERSWLSDSFSSATDVSPLSWFASSFEVVGALLLAVAGWLALRQRGGLASAAEERPDQLPVSDGVRHPMVAAFLVFNLVVVLASLTQL